MITACLHSPPPATNCWPSRTATCGQRCGKDRFCQRAAGRRPPAKKGDPLDFAAGITLHKKRGDYVHKGESLATFYGAADKFEAAAAEYRSGLVYGAEKPEEAPLVYALVTKDGVERY